MDIARLTIADVRRGLTDKAFSCRELIEEQLAYSRRVDPSLGAFLRWRPAVVAEAKECDRRLAAGQPLRLLDGVPVALKDNLCLRGEEATAGSKILEHYRAPYTATAAARLQAAGALIIGKTNLDEFAMGASTENSAFQPTKNPWDATRVPGGSSGGSAVAVASGQSVVALGSDTGGSIRQPAGFCGVVGLKPTYGRVSRSGLIALASSLDQIGPFARTVTDAAEIYRLIAGNDEADATSSTESVGDVLSGLVEPLTDLRIGLPKEFFSQGVDREVIAVVEEAAKVYERLGAKLVDVSIPHAPQALAMYYILQPAEASSNLARYDGVRYGLSVRQGRSLEAMYKDSRAGGFGPEPKRRIMVGTFALSAGYADAYYHQADRLRAVLREEFHRAFDQADILLSPVSPTPAFTLGSKNQDPLTMYLADLLTVPANLTGSPAMSLPAGFVGKLPVGMQLMARYFDEATLFRAAYAYEQATDWHRRQSPIPSGS